MLPKLSVIDENHHLENGQWVSVLIEVEVVSLHFARNTMRVRSVDKISYDGVCKPEIHSFDMPSDLFWETYNFIRYPKDYPIAPQLR